MTIKKMQLIDPHGILMYEERVIPFFMTPFFGAPWTISYGPGLIDRLVQVVTRGLRFEPYTSDGVKFAEDIRRNLLK